jgi:glycosyltransferase involved in cell wall biosynthesis
MRIALLSHFYPPLHTAGIEQNTHSIARGLVAAGHDVRVLCCGTWAQGDEYFQKVTEDEWQGIPVRRFHVNWTKAPYPHVYMTNSPVLGHHTRGFLQEFAPDLVHITSMYTLSLSAIHAAKSLGLPVVCTFSDFWTICPRHTLVTYGGTTCDGRVTPGTCHDCLLSESPMYRAARTVVPMALLSRGASAVLRRPDVATRLPGFRGWAFDVNARRSQMADALRRVDCILTASQYVRDAVVGTGITSAIEVSHYGHDLDWLERYRRRTPDGTMSFGYIGQVVPIKGVHVLLEAFLSGAFREQARLSIHGGTKDGSTPYEQSLRERARGAANVTFKGPYGRPDLPHVLGDLDVIVVPSTWPEVAGLVVQEGFAAGLPVIASSAGGLPEFVQAGKGGVTVPPGDADALKQALEDFVAGGEPYLARLRAAMPPIRTRQDEVAFLVRTYARLLRASQ